MKKSVVVALSLPLLAGACTTKSAYEAAVEDFEPVYCYRYLMGVECTDKPKPRDAKRLVNYYGPAPHRYDQPEPEPEIERQAPKMVNYWVKDPEPVPRPMPKMAHLNELTWLQPGYKEEQKVRQAAQSTQGTEALLNRVGTSLHGPAPYRPEPARIEPLLTVRTPVPAQGTAPSQVPAQIPGQQGNGLTTASGPATVPSQVPPVPAVPSVPVPPVIELPVN